jgi:hypothetical protein
MPVMPDFLKFARARTMLWRQQGRCKTVALARMAPLIWTCRQFTLKMAVGHLRMTHR